MKSLMLVATNWPIIMDDHSYPGSGYREILVLMQVMQFGVTVAQSALSSDI